MRFEHGEMVYRHYLIPEDYTNLCYIDDQKPEVLDSAFIDAIIGMDEKYNPCVDWYTSPTPDDRIVIFNSWTNKITYIIIAISSILLIINILNIKNFGNKRTL